ncbi:MAG: fibronectin type III domain-containing protein, partial [Cellulosimicrobium cellulans]
TTCTLDGLTNNVKYTFTVFATNAVGDGPASPPSAEARPDEKPDPPAAPTLEFGDQSLTVTWTNKAYTDRSPIETVDLEISPAPPGGAVQKTALVGTSVTWDGLKNGVAYKVRVRANNLAPDPSDWGEYSTAETPAGKPAAPGKPTAKRTSIGDTSQMQVAWAAPSDNGAAISKYTIEALQGGSVVKTATAGAGATSTTIGVSADTTGYTFRVRAHNKATDKFGDAEFSPASDPVRAFAAPSTVSNLRATANGTNKQIQLSFGAASGNGVKANEISYEYAAGDGWKKLADNKIVGGLTNGTAYSIKVRAVANVDGANQAGEGTTANSATPYGPPPRPTVSASGGKGQVTFKVSGTTNGRNVTISVSGAKSGSFTISQSAGSGSNTYTASGLGYSENAKLCAVAKDSEGNTSAEACDSDQTEARPVPTVYKHSDAQGEEGCGDSSCRWLGIDPNGATGSVQYQCWGSDSGWHRFSPSSSYSNEWWTINLSNGRQRLQCYYGWPGQQVQVKFSDGTSTPVMGW